MGDCIELVSPVPGKNTVVVHADDARWEVARAAVEELQLQVGCQLTPALLADLQEAATRREAAVRALRHLERRPRTELEMRRRLSEDGYASSIVQRVVRDLRGSGLLDDRKYADWYVEARLSHRPTGAAALVRAMCDRGVPREVADAAAARVATPEQEVSRALAAARKRLPGLRGLTRERAIGRLSRFLGGRGFDDFVVRAVCCRILDHEFGCSTEVSDETEF